MLGSIFLAKNNTIKMVINAAMILAIGKVNKPKMGRLSWKNITITAPTEAPEDTPNVYGSANGFLSSP